MYRPRVIPCLLLHEKGLVKTIQFKDPTYVGDPINAVKIYNDHKADELVFLDISANEQNRTAPVDVVQKIGDEAYMPFAVGGGIRTTDDIRAILNAGAEKVVINSAAVTNPDLISNAAEMFGNQSIIISIDAKSIKDGSYEVFINSGTQSTGLTPAEVAQTVASRGAGEILINSIDRDGTMQGYDLELIRQVTESVTIPVIACGGAGDYEDLAEPYYEANASAMAAGSLFVFIGKKRAVLINYPDKEDFEDIFQTKASDERV